MGFNEYLEGHKIAPICSCNTCKFIYEDFIRIIKVNEDSTLLMQHEYETRIKLLKEQLEKDNEE